MQDRLLFDYILLQDLRSRPTRKDPVYLSGQDSGHEVLGVTGHRSGFFSMEKILRDPAISLQLHTESPPPKSAPCGGNNCPRAAT